MKWYWWLIIVIVPLGVVAYFFYKAGEKADAAAHARSFRKPAGEKEKDSVIDTATTDVKVNE